MSSIKNKFTLNAVLLFSVFALITAYFIQYILDHEPCNLCLIERIPYLAAIILILILISNVTLMNDSENTDSILIDESIPEQSIPEIPEQTIPEIPSDSD